MSFLLGLADEIMKLAGADGKCSQCEYTGSVPSSGACPKCGGKMSVIQEDAEAGKKEEKKEEGKTAPAAPPQGE